MRRIDIPFSFTVGSPPAVSRYVDAALQPIASAICRPRRSGRRSAHRQSFFTVPSILVLCPTPDHHARGFWWARAAQHMLASAEEIGGLDASTGPGMDRASDGGRSLSTSKRGARDALARGDVGGTFTDLVLFDPAAGKLRVLKTPSTPRNQSEGILAGIGRLGVEAEKLERMVHGTTVATNTALERDGARLAVLVTAGHKDVLVVGRGNRMAMYNIKAPPMRPLVPRSQCIEVHERLQRRRIGREAARRGRGGRDRRAAGGRRGRCGGDLLPALLRQSRARAEMRGDRRQAAPRGDGHDLGRGASRVPGVRALLDDRAQRLRGAAHAPLSRRPAQQACRGRHGGAAVDHDVERRLAARAGASRRCRCCRCCPGRRRE